MTRRALALAAALAAIAALIALGVWQLERRTWKLALIAQVEQRLAAAPVAAPGPAAWGSVGDGGTYTRVRVTGRYLTDRNSFTQAVTDYGGGYWVMTPLVTDAGWTVLVNRGFVPTDRRGRITVPVGPVEITGLLRTTEPGGGFLRRNDAAADRWYSRDVAAIARKRGIASVAPYFIDAAADPAIDWPRGGLTVVRFRNSHLSYALTWFALAALVAGMLARAVLKERRG